MMIRPAACSILLVAILGCNNPADGPSPAPDFRVSPAVQWSGGQVVVVSDYFVGLSQLRSFKIDTFVVGPTRINDSTVSLQLPGLPSGNFAFRVADPAIELPVGHVQIAGFRQRRLLSPGIFSSRLSAYSTAVGSLVVGMGPSGDLRGLNLTSGLSYSYPGLRTTPVGPSPSYLGSDVLVLMDSAFNARQYRVGSSAQLADSGFSIPGGIGLHLATFSPGIYLVTGGQDSYSVSPGPVRSFATQSVWSVLLSPRHDRAVLNLNAGTPGDQVFDMATGDTAYTLPLRSVYGRGIFRGREHPVCLRRCATRAP